MKTTRKSLSVFLALTVLLVCVLPMLGCDKGNDGGNDLPTVYSQSVSIVDGNVTATFEGGVTLSFGTVEDFLFSFEVQKDNTCAVGFKRALTYVDGVYVEKDGTKYILNTEQCKGLFPEITFPASFKDLPVTEIQSASPSHIYVFDSGENPNVGAGDILLSPSGKVDFDYTIVGTPDMLQNSSGGNNNSDGYFQFTVNTEAEFDENNFLFQSVTKINVPASVTTIEKRAFEGFAALQSVTLPEGLTFIGESAFENCAALNGVNIPSTVTEIGDKAFANCTSLTSLAIPETVTKLGDWVLSGCKSLSYLKTVLPTNPLNGTYHWFASFAGGVDKGLTLEICGGEALDTSMLGGCDAVTKIIVNNVPTIRELAFYECPNLEEIVIGEGVTRMDNSAVGSCPNLKKVTFLTTPDIGHDVISLSAGYHADFQVHYEGTLEELDAWINLKAANEWFGVTVVCTNGPVVVGMSK